MLSFALAVQHPELVAVALPVSGWLPESLILGPKPDAAPPIVALHGDADEVLTIQRTRDAVAKLRSAGYDAELLEYPGVGHGVSGQMRRELYRRLAEATAE
jgi:phospholipase/carboxylesterase